MLLMSLIGYNDGSLIGALPGSSGAIMDSNSASNLMIFAKIITWHMTPHLHTILRVTNVQKVPIVVTPVQGTQGFKTRWQRKAPVLRLRFGPF